MIDEEGKGRNGMLTRQVFHNPTNTQCIVIQGSTEDWLIVWVQFSV